MFVKTVCCVMVLLCFNLAKNQASFFVTRKHYTDPYYYCVTNSSNALSWIYEDSETTYDYLYLPGTNKENTFDCDINDDFRTKRYYTKKPWTLQNSLDSQLNDIILDERWEKMPVVKTIPVFEDLPLKYSSVLNISSSNFNIPLSIRTKIEAHIFLCDGSDPSTSNCYWFMLQAFHGNASAIRKCSTAEIPSRNNVYPSASCSMQRINITHPPSFFSDDKWSHFLLSKRNQVLTFSGVINNKKTTFLEWEDEENVINVTNLILHSKNNIGLWKIHKLNFLYTQITSNDVQLGPQIVNLQGFVCISMYVSMCSSCEITLSLVSHNVIIKTKTFQSEYSGWTKIRFITDTRSSVNLTVTTTNSTLGSYWAIDDVRLCQKEEVRAIKLNTNAKCQLMSSKPDDIIDFKRVQIQTNTFSDCPENTIGDFCVPCTWVFPNCDQITVCSKLQCFCSVGYSSTDCYNKCPDGLYGHGCQKKCGQCAGYWSSSTTCNNVDGTCPYACLNSYSGPKCDIPPSLIFEEPPTITSVSYTEAKVLVSNFKFLNFYHFQQPEFYFVQYKKTDNLTWTNVRGIFKFLQKQNFTISSLEPDTQYYVRGVIVINRNSHSGPHLKYSSFTTKCDDFDKHDIEIAPSNTTVFISIKPTLTRCKNYFVTFFGNSQYDVLNNDKTFLDLQPFTEYDVKIYRNAFYYTTSFKTTEGIPTRIEHFKATPSETSIHIEWSEPHRINGKFKHYIVEYRRLSSLACSTNNQKPLEKTIQTVTNTALTINHLKPYSNYGLYVTAANTKFEGPLFVREVQTSFSNDVKPEELPQILNIIPDFDSAVVKLNEFKCENLRGPIQINVITNCSNQWCSNRNAKNQNWLPISSAVNLNNLIPFSDFNLEIQFCRPNGSCRSQRKTFRTKPTVPRKVRNLLVYTKNSSSVSLRWQPPYPPTGNLAEYKIVCFNSAIGEITSTVKVTPCKIWPQLHCATLSNLKEDRYYTFKISARNEEPKNFEKESEISTQTITEKPESPYELKIKWTKRNNLKLQWKHPNQTNGNLKFFQIEISNENTREIIKDRMKLTEHTYNFTYSFKINGTKFLPTTEYTIALFANNGIDSKQTATKTTSPPAFPILENKARLQSFNSSINVLLAFKKLEGKSEGLKMFVLRSGQNSILHDDLQEFDLQSLTVVAVCDAQLDSQTLSINLGTRQNPFLKCQEQDNVPLNPGTIYNVTIIVINTFNGTSRKSVFSYMQKTLGEVSMRVDSSLFGLLVLLLVIPILVIIYWKRHNIIEIKNRFFNERDTTSKEELDSQDEEILLTNVTTKQTTLANIYSKPVKITEFKKYVKDSIRNGELARQHAFFPRGKTKSWRNGSLKANRAKNRYNNLLAYDHSRVVLKKIDGLPHSDYINANYIDGHKVSKAYIATQGPKVETLDDFWRMIWQENVRHIANLANIYESGKKKLEKYWPDANRTLHFDEISVQHVAQNVFADYEHRIFNVTHKAESRKLEQLHFTSWPDHGVPLYSQSLIPFLRKMLQIPVSTKSPILVHCSAGVGRTGTILLCDISLRMAAKEDIIDLLQTLQNLREQRANMVDNIEQYKLAHLVVLECLVGLNTSIQCGDLKSSIQNLFASGALMSQIKYLEDTHWQDQAMKTVGQTEEEPMIVEEKNRFGDIIPEIQGRVFISRCPPEDDTSSYINAVKVDGFRCPGRFIVTQQPLPNTLGDFWRLIDENTTTAHAIVVSLNKIDPKDPTSCHFWPPKTHPKMIPVPHIALNHINTLPLECYDVVTVHLNTQSRQEPLQVQILALKNWAPKTSCPEKIEEFLSFWEQISSAGIGANPIFVTCYDGVTASGLFVAMSFIIEKMKLEQVCDVCQAVRNVRHNRPQFVRELEQFEFLYKAAMLYINGFK